MANELGCAICSLITLALALSLVVAGLLTTGWTECEDTEYGLFEACTPTGSCRSYDGGENYQAVVEALIITGISTTSIALAYLVARLILTTFTCGPMCNKIHNLSPLVGLILFLGGIGCIVGVVVFAAAVEVPCSFNVSGYSAYITGVGGALAAIIGISFCGTSNKVGDDSQNGQRPVNNVANCLCRMLCADDNE